jgi:hypothetical protein
MIESAETAEGCPGLRRGLLSAVPAGLSTGLQGAAGGSEMQTIGPRECFLNIDKYFTLQRQYSLVFS